MSGSGAAGGALAGVILALLGYDGLSFVALALVVAVVVRVMLTTRHRTVASVARSEVITYDI